MPITYKTNVAVFKDVCSIEEGDELLQWLLDHPKGKLNLKSVTHIHTALTQIILCKQPAVSMTPEDPDMLKLWQTSFASVMEP
ncbi:hypothetical protein ACFQ45_16560 [Rhodanobacter aciditrophus]|uniref:Uncharacterized protein n=1 Tax=Rhodanobacter aciditrophus TaxID=1623218 RepID=A0ABW4B4X6_9GAMM